jgi:maltoporin
MFRTLSELRDKVDRLIDSQGEDAPCASFVFTKEDVFYYDDQNEINLNADDTCKVLRLTGRTDYIYEQIGEVIDEEIGRIRRKITL